MKTPEDIRQRLEEIQETALNAPGRSYEIGLTLGPILRLPPSSARLVLLRFHQHLAQASGVAFEDGWLETMSRIQEGSR